MSILDCYQQVQQTIAASCVLAGRQPDAVQLLAVSKQQSWPAMKLLYDAGQRDFGENRLPEAMQKKSEAPADCRWHWIGTLQKNKVRKVVGQFSLIHSVDSIDLARKISEVSGEFAVSSRILLQANMSGEAAKHGLIGDSWKVYLEELMALPHLQIEGMMTMAALDADEKAARRCFSKLRHLRDELRTLSGDVLSLHELSMGMSRDFIWAIQEGASIVRVGSMLWNS